MKNKSSTDGYSERHRPVVRSSTTQPEGKTLGHGHGRKTHNRLLPGRCVEAAAQPAAGTPDAEGEDSQECLPRVSETVTPTPGGLTIVPQRRGQRSSAGATHFQLISHDPSGACTCSAVASNIRRCWDTLQVMNFKGQTRNFKKSHKTLKSTGSLPPMGLGSGGRLSVPAEGRRDSCSAGAPGQHESWLWL